MFHEMAEELTFVFMCCRIECCDTVPIECFLLLQELYAFDRLDGFVPVEKCVAATVTFPFGNSEGD